MYSGKESFELRTLDCLRVAVDDFPQGRVEHKDSPDFRIHARDSVLGIEITRIVSGNEACHQDSERNKIVALAMQEAQRRGLPPVLVDVYFRDRVKVTKRERAFVVDALVKLVHGSMPAIGQDSHLEIDCFSAPTAPPCLDALSVRRCRAATTHLWQSADAGIVNEHFTSELRQIVNKKENKLDAYRSNCNTCWLAVAPDFFRGPSGFFELSADMRCEVFETDFDRVYFVNVFSADVVQLDTGPTVTPAE